MCARSREAGHQRVQVPPLGGCELGGKGAGALRQALLEVHVCDGQVRNQLLHQQLRVGGIHQGVDQVQGPPPDADVRVTDAGDDCAPVPLHRLRLHANHLS